MDKKETTKILSFFAMSDGCLTVHKGCKNASFHISQRTANVDLFDLIEPHLKAIEVGYSVKSDGVYSYLHTKVHPFLTTLYERVYQMGRKVPSHHDFKLLDWEAMAVLFMCDGSVQQSGPRLYPMLNLCRWSYPELCWVKVQVKDRLGVDMNVYKCGRYWRLGVPAHHCDEFFAGVDPYLTPSFSYKHPNGRPRDELSGGDIVRPMGQPMETGGNVLSL